MIRQACLKKAPEGCCLCIYILHPVLVTLHQSVSDTDAYRATASARMLDQVVSFFCHTCHLQDMNYAAEVVHML